jgi:Domain of unknown function (DUF4357)
MTDNVQAFGRTIQLFLADGTPSGLIIASIHGWTGSVLVASQSTFDRLLARPEVDRTGIYIFYGPDPKDPLGMRAYIGEADSVRDRIDTSAKDRDFWETAIVVTTSDEAINKGHARYLEARLIEMARTAGRVALDNGNEPPADRRRLSEADRANMEAFLENLRVILPVVGLDLLKPRVLVTKPESALVGDEEKLANEVRFEIRHRSGVKAYAVEADGEFVVLAGSQALKEPGYARNSYAGLKEDLVHQGVLVPATDGKTYEFTRPYAFKSPSAAGSVVLDRNTNGRTRWYVSGTKLTYHEWQEQKAQHARSAA